MLRRVRVGVNRAQSEVGIESGGRGHMSDQDTTNAIYRVRYQFTREELRELGLRLAAKTQELYSARDALKASAASARAFINECEAEAGIMVRALNELAEWREVECWVMYNSPRRGVKSIVRRDTGEVDHQEPMTPAELQRAFNFEAQASAERADENAAATDQPQ